MNVKDLPYEIRRIISSFYNWNLVLTPKLTETLEFYIEKRGCDVGSDLQQLFWHTIHRIEWSMHLIINDKNNWRIPKEVRRLLQNLDDLDLIDIKNQFSEFIKYNQKFIS